MKLAPALCVTAVLVAAGLPSGGCYRDSTISTERVDRGSTAGPATRRAGASSSVDGWQSYGEMISADLPAADVADVLAQPAAYAGRDLQLRGTIAEVCAKKGCWLRIADPSGGEETVFVKFTCPIDGERLIPADAAGQAVIVQGQVIVEEMSEDEARHYAADAGKSAEEIAAITGPQRTIRVMSPSARVKT